MGKNHGHFEWVNHRLEPAISTFFNRYMFINNLQMGIVRSCVKQPEGKWMNLIEQSQCLRGEINWKMDGTKTVCWGTILIFCRF